MLAAYTSDEHYVLMSLPRSGSTSIARVLNVTPATRCLIEPFNERHYKGRFNRLATDGDSLERVLRVIWRGWPGFKHVWEPDGWPFRHAPTLNDRIVLGPRRKIIWIARRNLLRRLVSNVLCERTDFWVGTRREFLARLDDTVLQPLPIVKLQGRLVRDKNACAHMSELLSSPGVSGVTVYYEDLFGHDVSDEDRLDRINELFAFVGRPSIDRARYKTQYYRYVNSTVYRWSKPDLYERIHDIRSVEDTLGSDDTGWLFS